MILLFLLAAGPWTALDDGLDLGRFEAPEPSSHSDSQIIVLRVDPIRYELVLGNASAGGEPKTAKAWAEANDWVAAINPSMFHPDGRSTERMVTDGHDNHDTWGSGQAMLVFDPVDEELPGARILDKSCDDWTTLAPRYESHVQSIRMLSCEGKNVWAQQPKKWSHAVIGMDDDGRVLLIHARSPWSTHDFIELLRGLPIDLKQLQYAEGGPEASLYVHIGDTVVERMGSFETGFFENDGNDHFWPLPNVLGVKKRKVSPPDADEETPPS